MDVLVFFIMQDQQGNGIIVQGQGYDITEISTPRVVSEIKKYSTLEDAIGFCFQIEDHAYYALVFPTASKGWVYDFKSKQWAEWNWVDDNGNFLRPRANCCMFINGVNLVGDWENGRLLKLDINTYTDDGQPLVWVRTFPHMVSNNNKVTYLSFQADIQPGTVEDQEDDPQMSLSWSDNKGVSYGNPVLQSIGMTGGYTIVPKWSRLGQARDRVFKLSCSANAQQSLNGAFIELKAAKH
jgi:hypothetical protein